MISSASLLEARFDTLEPELQRIIMEVGEVREFSEGDVIMRTGDPIRSTMLLIDGRIKVYRVDDEGNEFLVYYIEPGEACALSMMCGLNNEHSGITAVSDTDTTMISIPFEYTGKWMSEFRSWDEFILRTYRNRFEEIMKTLDQVVFRSMDERLYFYLKRKSERGNELNISHQEIANDLNSAREVISRLLKKMEQLGALKLQRNKIILIDLDLLM
jgi:CRP/FNR family transcriptional regulator